MDKPSAEGPYPMAEDIDKLIERLTARADYLRGMSGGMDGTKASELREILHALQSLRSRVSELEAERDAAVLAEREACAQIAKRERHNRQGYSNPYDRGACAMSIAIEDAIRASINDTGPQAQARADAGASVAQRESIVSRFQSVGGDGVDASSVKTSQAALRAQEAQALAEFARYIISEYCWGDSEPDGGDVQDVAEKLGLIEPHIATAEDAAEQTDFEPGDTIYKFATWLNQPHGLSAGEAPSAETVNSNSQAIASGDEGEK